MKNIINALKLLFIPCSLFAQTPSNSIADTFIVENIPLAVSVPADWLLEEVNDGICSDTTYNFVMRYQINKSELGGHVALQILENKTPDLSVKEYRKGKEEYTVSPNVLGKWGAHYVTYLPKKIPGCKPCGKEFMNVHVVPLSDRLTMYIYFVAHGAEESVNTLRGGFSSFTNTFFQKNGAALDHFLLLNEMKVPVYDTVVTKDCTLNFYYNNNFTVNESTNGFSVNQLNPFFSPLKITVTTKALINDISNPDTIVSSFIGYQFGTHPQYNAPQNFLTINCNRYTHGADGRMVEIQFQGSVQIEDEALMNYYKRVVQRYANTVAGLSSAANENATRFSFSSPTNARRYEDMTAMSGLDDRFGYINHDSLLSLMPGYLAAKDSVAKYTANYYETITAMEAELRQKERECDSLKSKSSPTINRLREMQLQQIRENKAAYESLERDSVEACERKYLEVFHNQLSSASATAIQQAKCAAMINSQNIPKPDPKKPREFINLNEEVARRLGLH